MSVAVCLCVNKNAERCLEKRDVGRSESTSVTKARYAQPERGDPRLAPSLSPLPPHAVPVPRHP